MKKYLVHASLMAAILLMILTCPASALTPYQPDARIEIMTETTVENTPGMQVFTRIAAGPVQKNADIRLTGLYNGETGDPLGTLGFDPDGTVSWKGKGATAKRFQSNHLLIIPGILIPMDVLPVDQFFGKSETEEYDFRRKAGGRTFVDRIRISVTPVSRDQAVDAQWLRFEKETSNDLKLIEAVDLRTGELIVKQLWEPGSDWWLYEQTPFRRSWRIR